MMYNVRNLRAILDHIKSPSLFLNQHYCLIPIASDHISIYFLTSHHLIPNSSFIYYPSIYIQVNHVPQSVSQDFEAQFALLRVLNCAPGSLSLSSTDTI
jgi:hypothetical protein